MKLGQDRSRWKFRKYQGDQFELIPDELYDARTRAVRDLYREGADPRCRACHSKGFEIGIRLLAVDIWDHGAQRVRTIKCVLRFPHKCRACRRSPAAHARIALRELAISCRFGIQNMSRRISRLASRFASSGPA